MRGSIALAALLFSLPAPAAEAPASILDARVELGSDETPTRAITRVGRGKATEWVAWSVPAIPGAATACCFTSSFAKRGCSLVDREESWGTTSTDDEAEPARELYVLVAVRNGQPSRVRIASPSCPIRGSDHRVVWLGSVDPEASIDLLGRLLDEKDDDLAGAALAGIAYHRAARADAVLEKRALDRSLDDESRGNAIFWAGTARADAGYRLLDRILAGDPDGEIRKQACFALSQSKAPGAADRIKRAAVEDRNPEVRAHALFCLSQAKTRDAGDWIVSRLDAEHDDHVREQAVFALSQLPDGTDRLLEVLRSKRDPETIRRALFWLGQSKDPRALEEIEKILDR